MVSLSNSSTWQCLLIPSDKLPVGKICNAGSVAEGQRRDHAASWTSSNRKGKTRLAGSVHCSRAPQNIRTTGMDSRESRSMAGLLIIATRGILWSHENCSRRASLRFHALSSCPGRTPIPAARDAFECGSQGGKYFPSQAAGSLFGA
jgi:hypothetical protein